MSCILTYCTNLREPTNKNVSTGGQSQDWPHKNNVYIAPFKKPSALFQQK